MIVETNPQANNDANLVLQDPAPVPGLKAEDAVLTQQQLKRRLKKERARKRKDEKRQKSSGEYTGTVANIQNTCPSAALNVVKKRHLESQSCVAEKKARVEVIGVRVIL